MIIRLATFEDLNEINEMFIKIVEDIQNNKKIDMLWSNDYPFYKFENDINNKEMYVLEDNANIVGSFAISKYHDPSYDNINWQHKDKKFFYINRLVISVYYQGKGYSKVAMNYVEEYAIKNNYEVIRLTVHEDNKIAISLYEKYGFKKVKDGVLIIEGRNFIGYEKNIT